jgi:hypothetical protein
MSAFSSWPSTVNPMAARLQTLQTCATSGTNPWKWIPGQNLAQASQKLRQGSKPRNFTSQNADGAKCPQALRLKTRPASMANFGMVLGADLAQASNQLRKTTKASARNYSVSSYTNTGTPPVILAGLAMASFTLTGIGACLQMKHVGLPLSK